MNASVEFETPIPPNSDGVEDQGAEEASGHQYRASLRPLEGGNSLLYCACDVRRFTHCRAHKLPEVQEKLHSMDS